MVSIEWTTMLLHFLMPPKQSLTQETQGIPSSMHLVKHSRWLWQFRNEWKIITKKKIQPHNGQEANATALNSEFRATQRTGLDKCDERHRTCSSASSPGIASSWLPLAAPVAESVLAASEEPSLSFSRRGGFTKYGSFPRWKSLSTRFAVVTMSGSPPYEHNHCWNLILIKFHP